jgi:glucose/arabinose dehydrogenase
MLAFGPDGMLWIGTGDGGDVGDPRNNGQTLTTLLGKMLRIDVNRAPYGIPADNPFATSTTNRREIWGWGLRNPWRYSFDRVSLELFVADVGQNAWEEVHVVPYTRASVNYGWKIMEGTHCFSEPTCTQTGLDIPVHEYGHTDGNCSITGGYVYRGAAIPGILGRYFYSDYCTGFLRSFRRSNGQTVEHLEWDVGDLGNVTSFGEDSAAELYILSTNGTVYRLSGP